MRRKIIVGFALAAAIGTGLAARAHTLSVMVSKFRARPGAPAVAYLSWGHTLPVDEFVDARTVEAYEVRSPSGSVQPLTLEGRGLQANEVKFAEEGAYQFAIARKPSLYNVVQKADGTMAHFFTPKSEVKLAEGDKFATSVRSRMFAKAIVVVAPPDSTAEVKPPAPLGHPMEIVPATPLSQLKAGSPSRFVVLLDGKPLAGAKVTATCVATSPDGKPTFTLEADASGTVEVTPTDGGVWILHANRRTPAAEADRATFDLESINATLTLGFLED